MLGALAGDIIGSVYEFNNIKTKEFPLFSSQSTFTDDTVLTVALADSILTQTAYIDKLKAYYRLYPDAGYGFYFRHWAQSPAVEPYNSWGNGAAMRVSPVGFAYDDLKTVLDQAHYSAAVTHNHPEGIKGAQATAAAIFLARTQRDKQAIKTYIEHSFHYDLSLELATIRPTYTFNESCQDTVPQALIAFLESSDYEDAIRNAISLGGDSDTLACITGGIAEAFYQNIPSVIQQQVFSILDEHLAQVTRQFIQRFVKF